MLSLDDTLAGIYFLKNSKRGLASILLTKKEEQGYFTLSTASDDIKTTIGDLLYLARVCFDRSITLDALIEKENFYIEVKGRPIALCSSSAHNMLQNICVHPIYQHKGIGRRFITDVIHVILEKNPDRPITLVANGKKDAWGSNLSLRMTFFASLGFIVGKTETIPHYRIKFYDLNITKSFDTYKPHLNIINGEVVRQTGLLTVLAKVAFLGVEYTTPVVFSNIIDCESDGILMIWDKESFEFYKNSKFPKIRPKLNMYNAVELTKRSEPPILENQYGIICHGSLLYSEPHITIPSNVELITFGSMASITPANLITTTMSLMNVIKNNSILAIQALFPPLVHSIKSRLDEVDTCWNYPKYRIRASNDIERKHFLQANLFLKDFSNRNIIETTSTAHGSEKSTLFYINAFKPGDLFFDMNMTGMNTSNDAALLQYITPFFI